MNTTPLESFEQETFCHWLRANGITFSSIPNSTFTTSWIQKRKNKQQGLNAGLPDLLLIVPCKDNKKRLVFIEMKRKKGGVVSESQKQWIEALNNCNEVGAYVCRGADEAIKKVEEIMNFNFTK